MDEYELPMQGSLVQKPISDPVQFFDLVNDLAGSAHLLCAVAAASKLGIFDLLIKPKSIEEIAGYFSNREMMFSLIRLIQSAGLITEKEDLLICTDSTAEFLSLSSPYSQIPHIEFILWHLTEHWLNLTRILRSGPVIYDEQEFYYRRSLPAMAANALTGRVQDVTRIVSSLPGFTRCQRMIDLGGGHGLYAMGLARMNPGLQAVVFDLPDVIPLAMEYIEKYGMEKQVSIIGGDFFTNGIGSGYDIILSSSNPSGKEEVMIPVIASALNDQGYFVNIQPADRMDQKDYMHQLERELWSFPGSDSDKKAWKKSRFFTPAYHQLLVDAGFDIVSIDTIPDHYIHGYEVTMVIAQKKTDEKSGDFQDIFGDNHLEHSTGTGLSSLNNGNPVYIEDFFCEK